MILLKQMPTNDANIIAGCIKGSPIAWNGFVKRFSGLVMWSIKSRLDKSGCAYTNSDAEDILQEVFLLLYNKNKLKQLKDVSKIAGWLSIISGNIAINYIMRVKGKVALESVLLEDTIESNEPEIRQQVDKKLQLELLAKEINSSSSKEKLVLNLYFVYGNTIDEIAQGTGIPQGTVSTILNRVKEKFKQKYSE